MDFRYLEFPHACVPMAVVRISQHVFFGSGGRRGLSLRTHCARRSPPLILPALPRRRTARFPAGSTTGKSSTPNLEEPIAAPFSLQYDAFDFCAHADRR